MELKIALSEAKLRIETPKGVINARNKSSSTKINAFSTFPIFRFFECVDFKIFLNFEVLVEKVQPPNFETYEYTSLDSCRSYNGIDKSWDV